MDQLLLQQVSLIFHQIFAIFTTNPIFRSSSIHVDVHGYSTQQHPHIEQL